MVRSVLRPSLPLEHLLPLVVSEAAARGGKRSVRPVGDDDTGTTVAEAEAATRALDATFARDEARARRRGDARRLGAAMHARDALRVLPPIENPFFRAARRAALLDLRASAALGNVPPAVARVLSEPLDADAQLGYAAALRELGQMERATRVERFVERTFGIDAITRTTATPRASSPARRVGATAAWRPPPRSTRYPVSDDLLFFPERRARGAAGAGSTIGPALPAPRLLYRARAPERGRERGGHPVGSEVPCGIGTPGIRRPRPRPPARPRITSSTVDGVTGTVTGNGATVTA